MYTDGNRGSEGTEDLRFRVVIAPGGAGKSSWIFSSNVILFVLFGKRRIKLAALVGGGGKGGSCVGLPGADIRNDLRRITEEPDLLRLCPPGDGSLGNRARSL